MRTLATLALLCCLACSLAMAQSVSTAQIAGNVTDASGAAVPGAQLVATQTATSFTRATTSGANGSYTLSNLPVGPYTLRVTATGFQTYQQTGIVLDVASNPTVNVALKVGAQTQEVEVASDAAMVETHATGVGDVVSQRSIVDLPLNGRQATNLILLSAGATAAPGGDLNTNKNYPTQTISVAGGQINGIAYLLDGASNNDPFNSLNLPFPFPDALQEFKVQTSALPAQYGAHASAAVNVVTKSGSNQFHGDLFEFVRNGVFNANNFFSNAKGLPRDSLKRNQFGGTVGGPIIKNKLVFFAGYQGTLVRSNPPSRTSYGVTQAMLNGDFTAVASSACQSKPVTLAAPFVNNKIDPTLFNKSSLAFLKHIPVSTDPCGAINYGISQNSHENQGIGRVDYTMNAHHSMFFRYFLGHFVLPIASGVSSNVLEANQVAQNDQSQSMAFGDNYTISPNTVNVFSASLIRTYAYRQIPPYPSPADIGVPVFSPIPSFMGISVSGAFSLGAGATNPGYFNSTAPQLADDLTMVRGNHQIQVGVSWIHAIMNTVNNRPTNGAFGFGASYTGLSMGDFLLGDLSSFLQGNPDWENDRENLLGAYAQDSWKLSPTLTLSYGLRWAPFLQQQNWNKWVENFNPAQFTAGVHSNVYSNAPAGLSFPGDPGYPGHALSFDQKKDMEPRAGLIWDPFGDGRTSIRASYGLFFDQPHMFFYTRESNNPPWGASINLTNPVGGFSNPWQGYPGGNPWPGLAAVGPNMPFPQAGVYVNVPQHVHPTYVQQWNVSAERQIGNNDAVSVSYVGNETTHLWLGTELNPAVYNASCGVSMATYKGCLGTTNKRRVLYLQNPAQGAYYSTIGQVDDGGTASYNALLVSERHRLSNGLSFQGNFAWSHCITDPATTELTGPTYVNPANRGMDRGNCASDLPIVVNGSVIGDSPWHLKGVGGTLANDWRLSTIFSWRSGGFSSPGLSGAITDPALTGTRSRPNVGTASLLLPSMTPVGTQGNLQYLNTSAFAIPAFGTFGNAGPATIPNPHSTQLDMSLSRIVKLSESHTVQLRWDVFNALNLVNFGAPNTGFGGSIFGQITSAGDPRIMQLAVKYVF